MWVATAAVSLALTLLAFLPARLRDLSVNAWTWTHDELMARLDEMEAGQ
jgi:hypothetical protein